MPSKPMHVQIASPGEVAKAAGGLDAFHFGIPQDHLSVRFPSPDLIVPDLIADDLLKEGDTYIDTLDNWTDFLFFKGLPASLIQSLLQPLVDSRKAGFALTLFGYIPLRIKIPGKGKNMAFSPHGKIVLYGHFGTNATTEWESWSASMSYDVVGADVGAMPATLPVETLDAIRDVWANRLSFSETGYDALFPSTTFLDGVAYYRAKADGNSTNEQWQRSALLTPRAGAGGPQLPLQVATVVTLDAQGPRGGRFGRFYLPSMGAGLNAAVYSQGAAEDLVAGVRTTLTSVNTLLSTGVGDPVELVVASGRGSGENRPVREVKVGRVPDTMRSRRRSLEEQYAVLPFQSI